MDVESVEKECGALGGLFQAIVNDMKVCNDQSVTAIVSIVQHQKLVSANLYPNPKITCMIFPFALSMCFFRHSSESVVHIK